VVNAIAHIHIPTPRLPEEGFVAGEAAAMPVEGRFALAIRLSFHNYAPQQIPSGLALHQQAAYELGGNLLRRDGRRGIGGGIGKAWWLWGWLGWWLGWWLGERIEIQNKVGSSLKQPK